MDTDTEVQTNLKIPKSLKEKLKIAAKENHRSMTAELIARLQESFDDESTYTSSAGRPKIDEATRRELLASLMAEIAEERLRQITEERERDK
jgi:uncharacterized membrane-anchored protein YhcB (DUF1043 family)